MTTKNPITTVANTFNNLTRFVSSLFLPVIVGGLFALSFYSLPVIAVMVFFPMVWLAWKNRTLSAAFIIAFYLVLNWEEVPAALKFFPEYGHYFAFFVLVVHALFMSMWWIIFYSPKKELLNLLLRAFCLTALLILPPLGYFVWLQPITAAGILFPGFGFLGLGLTVLIMLFLVSLLTNVTVFQVLSIFFLCVVALALNIRYEKPSPPSNWIAVNTHLGNIGTSFTALPLRQNYLIAATQSALQSGAKVILFPENIASDWLVSSQMQWNSTFEQAKTKKADVILGAQIDTDKFNNVFILFGRDGYQVHPARQPMPLGLWKPWQKKTFETHWFNSGKMLVQNRIATYLICYEQMIPFPLFYSFLFPLHPTIILSGANQWFAKPSGFIKQSNVLFANARLFGVSVLLAVNS